MALGRMKYVPEEEFGCPRCGSIVVRVDVVAGVEASPDEKKTEMNVNLSPHGCTLRPCNHHFDISQGKA